jgi:superfamily I DNA/RNA helicase
VKSKVAKDARPDWENFCASLSQVAETMRTARPDATVEVAIDGWYGDYLKGAFADYVDRLEELKALIGFAGRFDEMQDMLAQIVLLNGETSDRQVDPDAEAVKLTTVHQAKGLEYDVVFLIGAADGQFPGRRSIEAGDVEEERRLVLCGRHPRQERTLHQLPEGRLPRRPRRHDAQRQPLFTRAPHRPLRNPEDQAQLRVVDCRSGFLARHRLGDGGTPRFQL